MIFMAFGRYEMQTKEIFPVFLFFTPFYLFFPFSGQLTHTHNLWMFGCSVSCYLSLISCPLTSSLIYAANCFFSAVFPSFSRSLSLTMFNSMTPTLTNHTYVWNTDTRILRKGNFYTPKTKPVEMDEHIYYSNFFQPFHRVFLKNIFYFLMSSPDAFFNSAISFYSSSRHSDGYAETPLRTRLEQ